VQYFSSNAARRGSIWSCVTFGLIG
jgi:hypothetical protein